ncbi:hypothetical protein HII31_04773 [Pseudocercospora fuligena]|uniref:Uncharacterized protein n=1 Tax=Pseudocercospora fuligena TaxID=685502 RepID=A0A8H6RN63_9PEZI|nr:hypothetical protein HII31_04773 [Pseudocercospora fuligena]
MYLDNIIVAALEVATVIVCPVTAPLIAGAHVADCAYDMNENGPTTGNVLGCAAAVVGVTGIPGGKQALDAIGFGEKGVRAGKFLWVPDVMGIEKAKKITQVALLLSISPPSSVVRSPRVLGSLERWLRL